MKAKEKYVSKNYTVKNEKGDIIYTTSSPKVLIKKFNIKSTGAIYTKKYFNPFKGAPKILVEISRIEVLENPNKSSYDIDKYDITPNIDHTIEKNCRNGITKEDVITIDPKHEEKFVKLSSLEPFKHIKAPAIKHIIVSNYGYLFNKRTGNYPGYFNINNQGYKTITIGAVSYCINRIVAKAFLESQDSVKFNPDGTTIVLTKKRGLQVNHKDENKLNNTAWNLEWCDTTYNINYGNRSIKQSETMKAKFKEKARKLPNRNSSNSLFTGCTLKVNGVVYDSIKQATEALGLGVSLIPNYKKKALDRGLTKITTRDGLELDFGE